MIITLQNKFNVKENFDLLLSARKFVLALDEAYDNLSIVNHKEGFLVSILNMSIYVESPEEFFILSENGAYSLNDAVPCFRNTAGPGKSYFRKDSINRK